MAVERLAVRVYATERPNSVRESVQPAERVRMMIDAFNEGDIDGVADRMADDVEVAIPVYRPDEPIGPPNRYGREHLRQLLLGRRESGVRIELLSISGDATSAVAVINSSRQGQLAVTFQFNHEGLAQRLVVFKQ